jgi:methionyl-tRNA formyltransferase
MKKDLKIVFMGTPGFAVPSLNILLKSGYHIVGVVTAPDKPVGRGQTIKFSPVKDYALKNQLALLQPGNLKDEGFIHQLELLKPDLQVVVAFRMLPEIIWKMPPLGTLNLHASLLPQYRGAAPINWAIINGESETGVTTFFINEKIDTGQILNSEKISIGADETAGELHDRLMLSGSHLLLSTIKSIEEGSFTPVSQDNFLNFSSGLKTAPKIFKEDCKINWNMDGRNIINFIRGLSPYPAAFTYLISVEGKTQLMKVFKATVKKADDSEMKNMGLTIGTIQTDQKHYLNIACKDGIISIEDLQIEGKRRMNIEEFLRGFKINQSWRIN